LAPEKLADLGGFIASLMENNPNDLFVICNLLACGGKAAGRWQTFLERAESFGLHVDSRVTTFSEHAMELARTEAKNGRRIFYVFGGDGTLNEVLNGVMENDRLISPEIELIYLTAGSSCDIAKLFPERSPITGDPRNAITYLADVGKIECVKDGKKVVRYFLANSSIGVISRSIEVFNHKTPFQSFLKRVNIDVAALYAGLKNVFQFGNMVCRLTFDGQEFPEKTVKNMTVFKCSYFGGGMNYGVPSTYDDGYLHVVTIGETGKFRTLGMIPSLYSGTILNKPQAEYRTVRDVRMEIDGQPVIIEADGEMIGYPPVIYSLLPKCVRLRI